MKYPGRDLTRLVPCIFSPQILGTRRMMQVNFDEFEKLMTQCFEVFTCWDDEYDKLQGLLR